MLARPMIGGFEPPRIERISCQEVRRLVRFPVAGLSGDLHHDLGRGALEVEIVGALFGDEARDVFLKEIRERFQAGAPVDFVADIVTESELEQVLIRELEMQESATEPDVFRYRIVLCEYTEPPAPPSLGMDLGLELDELLDLEALDLLDALDLPALTAAVPPVGDLLAPVRAASEELTGTLLGAASLFTPLDDLFGGG